MSCRKDMMEPTPIPERQLSCSRAELVNEWELAMAVVGVKTQISI